MNYKICRTWPGFLSFNQNSSLVLKKFTITTSLTTVPSSNRQNNSIYGLKEVSDQQVSNLEKTTDISWRHRWFPHKMTSEKRVQKFHTDDASLTRWEVFLIGWTNFLCGTTNQNHHTELGTDTSSVWDFYTRFSDVISRGNQWWRPEMSAVFSG